MEALYHGTMAVPSVLHGFFVLLFQYWEFEPRDLCILDRAFTTDQNAQHIQPCLLKKKKIETGSCYIAQAGLELLILSLWPPELDLIKFLSFGKHLVRDS